MQQQKFVNKILKLIEQKQKKKEFGSIEIKFQRGMINAINDNEIRKITLEEE